MSALPRELTREERDAIRKLVVKLCANYSRHYGCLPLDGECYMLGKWWSGVYCKYFAAAVLPLDPEFEAALLGVAVDMRGCAICGQPFYAASNRAKYCKPCAGSARRKRQRGYMMKNKG